MPRARVPRSRPSTRCAARGRCDPWKARVTTVPWRCVRAWRWTSAVPASGQDRKAVPNAAARAPSPMTSAASAPVIRPPAAMTGRTSARGGRGAGSRTGGLLRTGVDGAAAVATGLPALGDEAVDPELLGPLWPRAR